MYHFISILFSVNTALPAQILSVSTIYAKLHLLLNRFWSRSENFEPEQIGFDIDLIIIIDEE